MSINKRQFNLLQAMGITVWQRRELSKHNSMPATETIQNSAETSDITPSKITSELVQKSQVNPKDYPSRDDKIAIDLDDLLKQQLFKDIISSLGASSADLSIVHNQIDLGIINWQFIESTSIEFKHNCLKTPDLTTLANSPELKKSLWQSIGALSSI